jgi:hypothetical protein
MECTGLSAEKRVWGPEPAKRGARLAQREPGLALPVEGGEPGQQHAQEEQQQVQLHAQARGV